MQKSILFIAHDSSLYGANQSLINLISSLRSKDIELTIVFPDRGPICRQLDKLKWDYHIVKFRTEIGSNPESIRDHFVNFLKIIYKFIVNFDAIIKLSKIVSKNKVNIIHSNSGVIGIGEELALKNNIKHVWHLREYINLDHGLHILGGLERHKRRIQNSDEIIAITKGIGEYFGVAERALILHDAVMKNGRDISNVDSSNYFLFGGALRKSKGIEDAIQAFYLFSKINKGYKFLIAGTGENDYEIFLQEMVSELKLNESVEFLGFRNDIGKLMSKAIAFLMCSKYEALGRVTPEAMLNYCSVIGFDNAGTSEIIKNRKTGLLYNDLNQLVDQMNYSVRNPKEMNIIKRTAYNFAQDVFTESVYGDKLDEFYSSLV